MWRTDVKLGAHARQMRNEPTEFEKRLWRHLSNSQLGGFKFRRQTVIGPFISDFFCPSVGLVIEIDGDTHDAADDARRDADLVQRGFHILRVTNRDVAHNIEGVLEAILTKAKSLSPRFPHPNPSPEGEGLK